MAATSAPNAAPASAWAGVVLQGTRGSGRAPRGEGHQASARSEWARAGEEATDSRAARTIGERR